MMSQELGMSYRKIHAVSLHANSEKNRILRQRFAIELFRVIREKKVILNVDETWLGMSDFRRMKWRVKGTSNSVPSLQLVPRVSMIVGLDSRGAVYLSLVQANSNSKIIEIFLQSLVRKLDKERSNWRKDTVLLWDNAPYHASPATLKVLEGLKIPVLYTGPHSYDASPVELFFAHFKRADVNPRHVKTGKR